jgi:hypothetical protein
MIVRMAFRLIRGGGLAGLMRMALMIVGIALGVAAASLVAVMPGVLDARAGVMNSRTPGPAPDGSVANFVFSTSMCGTVSGWVARSSRTRVPAPGPHPASTACPGRPRSSPRPR